VWNELSTSVIRNDETYTYFESQIVDISGSFAIGGIKEDITVQEDSSVKLEQVNVDEVAQTENQSENNPVGAEGKKAPGFEIVLSTVAIVSMIYLVRRMKR